jgi:hypothetical protein
VLTLAPWVAANDGGTFAPYFDDMWLSEYIKIIKSLQNSPKCIKIHENSSKFINIYQNSSQFMKIHENS